MKASQGSSGTLIALGALGAVLAWGISQRQGIFMLLDAVPVLAMVGGAALGVLVGWCLQLSARLTALERHLEGRSEQSDLGSKSVVERPAQTAPKATKAVQPDGDPVPVKPSAQVMDQDLERVVIERTDSRPTPAPDASSIPDSSRPARKPSRLRNWLFAGNLPVRVGVLVLLVGVAALLRYVTEQGWLSFPIELRLGLTALAGVAGLVFGWVQRFKRRAFGLVVQGGAIGVILLTVFAADRLYGVIPGFLSFGTTVVLVFGVGVLSAAQRAQWLAVFGMLAGFAAPFALGDGQSGPGPLFAWYAILNLGVFGLAWQQNWPLLNRIGFAFTFALTTLWGVLAWSPQHEALATAYLGLFFLLYFLIPILEVRRAGAADKVDPVLVFGLPLIATPLYGLIVEGDRVALASVTIALAVLYLISAIALIRRSGRPVLGRAHAVLAIALATLAVPLTVSEYTVILIWALQGGALVWYGCRQASRWTRWSGLLLQGLAAGLWLVLLALAQLDSRWLVFNADFYGGLALALAAVVSAMAYQRAGAGSVRVGLLVIWAALFWLVNGAHQLGVWFSDFAQASWGVAFLAITAGIAAELHRRASLIGAGMTAAAAMLLALFAVFEQFTFAAPLSGWAALAWVAIVVAALHTDRSLAASPPGPHHSHYQRLRLWHALLSHAAVSVAMSASLVHWTRHTWMLGDGWTWLLAASPWLMLTVWLFKRDAAPLCLRSPALRDQGVLLGASVMLLLVGGLVSLTAAGSARPLPWLTLLNPLELGQIAALLLALVVVRAGRLPWVSWAPMLLAGLGFLMLSSMALRAVHHLLDLSWQLPVLLSDARAQAALSVLWTVLGTTAWLWGSRRANYAVWLSGAILLGVVLLKLLLIDRSYLSTVAGILSFLAFGVLAIAIGFFAPAPPRTGRDAETAR